MLSVSWSGQQNTSNAWVAVVLYISRKLLDIGPDVIETVVSVDSVYIQSQERF